MEDENRPKKSIPSSSSGCDVVLGLNMQRTESLPSKRTMVMPHHPTICTVDSAAASYGINPTAPLLPLPPHLHLLPPSVKMPFTVSQWQELERQRMIYKYMSSSTPIPTELLFSPLISDLPSSQSNTSGLELKFSRSTDPEPWRCRRTDGKKWRCSRDVTPDQKYCERHAHKNRPRSRKPVETQTHNSSSVSRILSSTLPATGNVNVVTPSPQPSSNPVFQFSSSSAFGQTHKRSTSDWLSSYGQQWQQFHEGDVDEVEDDDDRRMREMSQNWLSNDDHNEYLSYISPDISANSNQMMTTRHFIDAWPSSSSKEKDDLVLNGEDNENVNSQLGIGILTQQSPWMDSHHQPGGPLGEALCPSNNNSGTSTGTTTAGKSSGQDGGLGFRF